MKKKIALTAVITGIIASTFTFACRGVPGPCHSTNTNSYSLNNSNTQTYQHAYHFRRGMGRWHNTGTQYGMGRMNGRMGQARQVGHQQHNPSQIVNQYPTYQISDELKEMLYNQYGEEKMARDLYLYAYEKYGVPVFKNIANSEQQHMNAVGALLEKYGITPPSDYAKDNELYTQLKAKIDEGLEQALNVGVTVEEVDIEDIAKEVKEAYDEGAKDVVQVLTNIAGGSYNHLRGFLNALKQYGYQLPDVSKYLPDGMTVDQFLSLWGPETKKLFPEYVKKVYGIDISNYIMTANTNTNNSQTYQSSTNVYNPINQVQNTTSVDVSKYIDNSLKEKLKTLILTKYKSKIDSLTTDKIEQILQKIPTLEEKILSMNISEYKKKLYINVLEALKEILQEKIENGAEDILNELF